MLSALDVGQHNSRSSCWVIVSGQAYDVTEFMDHHPGGAGVILRYAGKVRFPTRTTSFCVLNASQDATKDYEPLHPPGTIERNLPSGLDIDVLWSEVNS
jgi:L-lactate dehydrogenase (cytochrome)